MKQIKPNQFLKRMAACMLAVVLVMLTMPMTVSANSPLQVSVPGRQASFLADIGIDSVTTTFSVTVSNPTANAISGIAVEALPAPGIAITSNPLVFVDLPAGATETVNFTVTVVGITQSASFPVAFRVTCPGGEINRSASLAVTVIQPQATTPPTTTPAHPPPRHPASI